MMSINMVPVTTTSTENIRPRSVVNVMSPKPSVDIATIVQ